MPTYFLNRRGEVTKVIPDPDPNRIQAEIAAAHQIPGFNGIEKYNPRELTLLDTETGNTDSNKPLREVVADRVAEIRRARCGGPET